MALTRSGVAAEYRQSMKIGGGLKRSIGGKPYYLVHASRTMDAAQNAAKKIRSFGYNATARAHFGGYEVWARKK